MSYKRESYVQRLALHSAANGRLVCCAVNHLFFKKRWRAKARSRFYGDHKLIRERQKRMEGMEEPTDEHEYDLPVWRYKARYIRSWFQWRMFLQNVATCVLGIYYIGWRVRLLVFKVTTRFRRY